MSGIVGVWNLDGRPVDRPELAGLSARLAHRARGGEGAWVEGPVGLVDLSEVRPTIGPSGAVLLFDGRLDNRDELLAGIGRVSPDVSDAAIVIAAHGAFGERFPERLNGEFALALFDPARRRLTLARDAVGVRPLYYARLGSTFVFASEIKAILAHPGAKARPNDAMLSDLLLKRLQLHPDAGGTCFDGISSLPPGHALTVTPERADLRQYWDFEIAERPVGRFEDHVRQFRELFAQAVKRRLRGPHPVVVSVSGGLDSSAIFGVAADHACRNPGDATVMGASYVSASGSPSDEGRFVDDLERHFGVTIERLPAPAPGVFAGARSAIGYAEMPMLDSLGNGSRGLLEYAQRVGARVVLTGHWGDQVLFDTTYLADLAGRFEWGQVRSHMNEYGKWFTDTAPGEFRRIFAGDLVRRYVPAGLVSALGTVRRWFTPARRATRWYSDSFREAGSVRSTDPRWRGTLARTHGESIYRQVRSKYFTMCLEWNSKLAATAGVELAFPFLDRDLLSFLIATPGQVQSWNGVPKALLRHGSRGVVPDSVLDRKWKADFSNLVNEGMLHDYPDVARLLGAESLAVSKGYVSAPALRRELETIAPRLAGSTCEASWALKDLLGLELWLQEFVGPSTNGA